jgi:hypothetical protein
VAAATDKTPQHATEALHLLLVLFLVGVLLFGLLFRLVFVVEEGSDSVCCGALVAKSALSPISRFE